MTQKNIGRYEIRSELGRGGMGAVYLAYDPTLEREVALKLLPSYFAQDPEFSSRFAREAKTVAGLDHQAIVAIYDYGEDDVWPYFVMRLMKGGSLKDRLAPGPVSLDQANQVLQRVAGALDKAHSNGIVHRDLKPGNILYDQEGQPYLSDFGIVRLAEGSENFTRTGNALGTPAYMSPEQADALPDIDGRSDVYSVGVVLYEMLAGEPPYQHDSMPRLLMLHLTAPIPNLLEARPDLPAGFQGVINKAMAKERADRYQTAGEMAAAVQTIVSAAAQARPRAQPTATVAAAVAAAAKQSQPPPAPAQKKTAEQQPAAAQKPATPPVVQPAAQQSPVAQPAAAQQAAPLPPVSQPAPVAQPAAQQAAPPPPVSQSATAQAQTPPPAAEPVKKSSSRKWIFALVGIFVVAVIGIAIVAAVVVGSGALSGSDSGATAGAGDETRSVVSGDGSATYQSIVRFGELRVGVSGPGFEVPPIFMWQGGEYTGFEADLISAMAGRLFGESIEIVYEPETGLEGLKGKVHLIGISYDPSSLSEWDAVNTGSYLVDGQRAIVLRESGITEWQELDGGTICFVAGTNDESILAGIAAQMNFAAEAVLVDTIEEAASAVKDGRCDAFSSSWIWMLFSGVADPELAIVGDLIGGITPYVFVLGDGDPEFRDELDQALNQVVEDGTYERLFRRWFEEDVPWPLEGMTSLAPVR